MPKRKSTNRPAAKYSKLSDKELVRFIMQQNNDYCLSQLETIRGMMWASFSNDYSAAPLFRYLDREIKHAKIIQEIHRKGIK